MADADQEIQFPPADDTRPREEQKNQPEYLGDKVDAAVHRMEERAEPLPDSLQDLLDDTREELNAIIEDEA